jgi:hypothetical protein
MSGDLGLELARELAETGEDVQLPPLHLER